MSKETMRLALEALKQIDEAMPFPVAKLAQAALREALAEQPAQQEPFAFYFETYSYEGQCSTWFVKTPCDGKLNGKPGIPLYTSPPAQRTWVGLTGEEQTQVAWSCGAMSADWLMFMEAVEKALKEKNA